MGAFLYRLEEEDGTPADPSTLRTAVPNWSAGDTIPLGHGASHDRHSNREAPRRHGSSR
jgi:hypothetical protein